ncbi:MAG: ATP-binding cassette domain-containing protein [Chloroflexi bacterium]|nr:ATP-binding cassette domain-containing protein [Chloroflexota bacterium]
MKPAIHVRDLTKVFKVPERDAGLKAATLSLFKRKYKEVRAVDSIAFDIQPGEVVGFLGPNGAGKTTTLKMLAGLLYPTSGELDVLGYLPEKRQKDFLRQITLVMGQRSQLNWDIPAIDSFELNRAIYSIPRKQYEETRDELIELMLLGDLINKPVRNLSLGERMKVEAVGALLHRPQVLFLDEPTIGLDVTMQRRIRRFIQEYNARYNATVLLTSHYMADVQALCKRVIVIHHGKLLYDGGLAGLVERFSAMKTLSVTFSDMNGHAPDFSTFGTVISQEPNRVSLRVGKAETPNVTARMLADLPVTDLTVEDPPIEEVIEHVFEQPKEDDEKKETA